MNLRAIRTEKSQCDPKEIPKRSWRSWGARQVQSIRPFSGFQKTHLLTCPQAIDSWFGISRILAFDKQLFVSLSRKKFNLNVGSGNTWILKSERARKGGLSTGRQGLLAQLAANYARKTEETRTQEENAAGLGNGIGRDLEDWCGGHGVFSPA